MSAKEAPFEGELVNRELQPTSNQIDRTMDVIEGESEKRRMTVVTTSADLILNEVRIIQFRGRVMTLEYEPYIHWRPLNRDKFDKIAYPIIGGVPRSRMGDIYAYICSMCDDLTPNGHLIGFGQFSDEAIIEADTNIGFTVANPPTIWDMRDLTISTGVQLDQCVWRSPYSQVGNDAGVSAGIRNEDGRLNFIMQLVGNDEGLYDDIMQSIAPIIMEKKPDGVVWWIGSGANGKSTLMDALYRIFPRHFASINVKRLVDGRDAPSLNGVLANVAKESSEGRIDDTEIYKCLGTHENFRVHRFHSQDDIEVHGNIHSIFSANSIPVFADKGYSIRRRTFIIPFEQEFKTDPDFETKTFTPEFFGCLIMEICKYANKLKRQGYRYKWSARTVGVKRDYDREASNAEEYAKQIINDGVVAFDSYNPVRIDYENWCADNGYVPLGIGNLRKAVTGAGFERVSARADDQHSIEKVYRLSSIDGKSNLIAFGMGRPGLFTITGFREVAPEPVEEETQTSILKGKW